MIPNDPVIWPPALVIISLLPVLAGHDALVHGRPWVAATAAAEIAVVALAGLTLGWLRFQAQVHAFLHEATGGAFGG